VVLIVIISLIALFFLFHFLGKPRFWKLTRRYPIEAYNFFLENDCWFVVDGINNSEPPKDKRNWDGPFSLFLPNINKLIQIYGKYPDFEKSEVEFIKIFTNRENQNVQTE
jgi:hypothetical protein